MLSSILRHIIIIVECRHSEILLVEIANYCTKTNDSTVRCFLLRRYGEHQIRALSSLSGEHSFEGNDQTVGD
jgi:hypothetical protein